MQAYDTVSEAINDLAKKGYTYNFNLAGEYVECREAGCNLRPDEFEIDEVYRFEGMTDPGDASVLFAISSEKHNLKGLLLNGYGAYSDDVSADLVAKLSVHHHGI